MFILCFPQSRACYCCVYYSFESLLQHNRTSVFSYVRMNLHTQHTHTYQLPHRVTGDSNYFSKLAFKALPFNILGVYQRVLWYDWYFETITKIFENLQMIAINLKLRKNKHRTSTKLLKFSLCNQIELLIPRFQNLDRNNNSKSQQHT